MTLFILGLAIFFGVHIAVLPPAVREKLPTGPRKGVVALASLVGFVLFVWGWRDAIAAGSLWYPPPWTRHVTLALMLPALILLVAAYGPASRIKAAVKHPMLAGVKVWALAHLIANGEVRSILLFGGFLLYAGLARFAISRRPDQTPPTAPQGWTGDLFAVVVGVVAYGVIAYYLHPILFGVRVVGAG